MPILNENQTFKEFMLIFTVNTTFQLILMAQNLMGNFDLKFLFIDIVVLTIGIVCYILYYLKLSHIQAHPGVNSIIVWFQFASLMNQNGDVMLGYVGGYVMAQYLSLQKIQPKQKNLAWKNLQNIIITSLMLGILAYNLYQKQTDPSQIYPLQNSSEYNNIIPRYILTMCGVVIIAVVLGTILFQKRKNKSDSYQVVPSPQNSIKLMTSPQIKNKEETQNTQVPRNLKWDQLIEKGLDNWYFTVNFKTDTKQIEIEKMNTPMEVYLNEQQLTGQQLMNRIRTLHFSTSYQISTQVQIDQDLTLCQILRQIFEEDNAGSKFDRKSKTNGKSLFNDGDEQTPPYSSQREQNPVNAKLFRMNTVQSKKNNKSFNQEQIKSFFEKQHSLISQINNVPQESRVKLDQSYQSLFAKSDLSLLLSNKQNKNKSYIPCVLTLEDNQQIYLSVSIITYNYDSLNQEFETAVIIENNHHQVLQNLQLINLQARVNITHNYIIKQCENNQMLLSSLVNEKQLLGDSCIDTLQPQYVEQISEQPSPSNIKISLQFTKENLHDNETTKRQILNLPIPPQFSFCGVDNNQLDSYKDVKDNNVPMLREKAISFQYRDKVTSNTLNIPTQVKVTKQPSDLDCETPLTPSASEPLDRQFSGCSGQILEKIIKNHENQQKLIQSFIYKSFIIVNDAFNYMDFFGEGQNLQSLIKQNFKLDQVVQNILNLLQFHQNVIKYDIKLTLDNRLKNVIMNSDKRKVKQLFTNLIENCIEAIKKNDLRNRVTVELSDDGFTMPRSKQSQIYVSITDTGQGLRQEHLDLNRVMDGKFGLLSIENTLNLLGPGSQLFKIRNLRLKDDIVTSGSQTYFRINRNGNFKFKDRNEEINLLGFKLEDSQFLSG